MLSSRAAEGDLKAVAAVFEIFVDRLADERLRRAEEAIHLVFVDGEKIGNGLVAARVTAQRFVQYGFGIARQSNMKPPPLPVLSSGNPRLYEKDRMVIFICHSP